MKLPSVEYTLDVYPIFRAISFSNIDAYITARIEMRLQEIYANLEETGSTAEEVMDILKIPNVIRSVYGKAVAIHKASDERITFAKIAGDVFKGLGCDLERGI